METPQGILSNGKGLLLYILKKDSSSHRYKKDSPSVRPPVHLAVRMNVCLSVQIYHSLNHSNVHKLSHLFLNNFIYSFHLLTHSLQTWHLIMNSFIHNCMGSLCSQIRRSRPLRGAMRIPLQRPLSLHRSQLQRGLPCHRRRSTRSLWSKTEKKPA